MAVVHKRRIVKKNWPKTAATQMLPNFTVVNF
jgi:hypothetical protein